MSTAFEITVDDVLNVVHKMGKKIDGDKADAIFDNLDQFKVEEAALYGNDMEEQTNYAYKEIERQITEGYLL
jgi:hypothetical protein